MGRQSTPAAIQVVEREARACELRLQGLTLQAIATELGYADPSGAFYAIQRALQRTLQPAADLRARDNATLELAISEAVAVAFDRGNPNQWVAMGALLQVLRRRAALMGLDAPSRKVVTLVEEEQLMGMIARLEGELRAAGHDPERLQLVA